MNSILHQIIDGALSASWAEQVATVLGLLFVWLAIRENLWNFPVGLVQAGIFGWVCFQGKLYSDAVLQVFYIGAMIYGWWHWTHGTRDHQPLRVQRLTRRQTAFWIAGTLVLWAIWGACMRRFTDAALPFWDGFIFAGSVAAQWLQARKLLENWAGWVVVNSVAIGVYWVKGYYWFAVLYFLFWLMAWGGWRTWFRSWKTQHV